jgi:S1-C subfamily serine protease
MLSSAFVLLLVLAPYGAQGEAPFARRPAPQLATTPQAAPARVAIPRVRRQESRPSTPAQGGRGYLGVSLTDDGSGGVGTQAVTDGSAAARAGLRAGDRILSLDGHPTDDYAQVVELVQAHAAGERVQLRIRRRLEARLDETRRTEDGRLAIGVNLVATDSSSPRSLEVSGVVQGYPAADAGIRKGDRIVEVQGRALRNYDELVTRMKEIDDPGQVAIAVERDLEVVLGQQPGDSSLRTLGYLTNEAQQRRRDPMPGAGAPSARPPGANPSTQTRGELQNELRALADELQGLRTELAQLRRELKSLRDSHRDE